MSGSPFNRSSLCSIFRGARQPGDLPRGLVYSTYGLMAVFAAMLSPLSAFADPVTGSPDPNVSNSAGAFITVNRLGESDRERTLRDGKLLSHHRTADPFGIAVRGPFKGLPPVVEQSAAIPAPPAATPAPPPLSQVAAAVNVPTLEKAIQELIIGAVNLGSHQILIGSRSINEGDLLVLQSDGVQFVVWVQSVGVSGVLFCDTDLQKHILKPFGYGPKELPMDQIWSVSEISKSLDQNAKQ